jgi:outer membrane protein assembly factor BamB
VDVFLNAFDIITHACAALQVGNKGFTKREAEAALSMWCVGKHPVILSFDLSNPQCDDCTPAEILQVLTHKPILDINQDPLGIPAAEVTSGGGCTNGSAHVSVWSGPLSGDAFVLMILNSGDSECAGATVDLRTALNVSDGTKLGCVDVWSSGAAGACGSSTVTASSAQNFTATVPSHGVVVLRFQSPKHHHIGQKKLATMPARQLDTNASVRMVTEVANTGSDQPVPATVGTESTVAGIGTGTESTVGNQLVTTAPWPMQGHDARHSGRSLTAHGPSNCNFLWNFGNCTGGPNCKNPTGSASMPAVSARGGGAGLVLAVLTWPAGSFLHALDLATGAQKWNVSLAPLLAYGISGVSGSPLLVAGSGSAEIAVIGGFDGNVSAFDVETGALLWRVPTGGPIVSSAVTADYADVNAPIFVGSWDQQLYKISREGKVLGAIDLGTELRSAPAVAMVGGTALVILTVGTSHVCVKPGDGLDTPTVLWRMNTTYWTYGTPSVSSDGKVAFFPPAGDRKVWARSTSSGKVVWTTPPGLILQCESVCANDGATEGVLGDSAYFIIARSGSNYGASLFAFSLADGTETFNTRNTQLGSIDNRAAFVMDADAALWTVGGNTQLTSINSHTGNVTRTCPSISAASGKGFHPSGSAGPVIARDGLVLVPEVTGGITAVGALGSLRGWNS